MLGVVTRMDFLRRSAAAFLVGKPFSTLGSAQITEVSAVLNFIDGVAVAAASRQTLENVNPATGKVLSTLPRSGAADVEVAVAAAKRAAPGGRAMPLAARAALLERVANIVEVRCKKKRAAYHYLTIF
jgi:delta 1-pyrroline-5-carboxylate dehydrogenase